MKTAKRQNTLIESEVYLGAYDMRFERMIIQHHKYGRLLLSQGFGGTDTLQGGAYRYSHGRAAKISETDTLESLTKYHDGYCELECLKYFEWSGNIIARIAESVKR